MSGSRWFRDALGNELAILDELAAGTRDATERARCSVAHGSRGAGTGWRRHGELQSKLRAVFDDTRRRFPDLAIARVRIWLIVDRAPAYPAPARLDRYDLAVLGELDADGTYRSALGTLADDGAAIAVRAMGLDLAAASLFTIRNDHPDPEPIDAQPTTTGFALERPISGDPVYVVAQTPGGTVRWLVAARCERGY